MRKNFNKYFFTYLITLLFFSIFFLYVKHDIGNDSTISEWLINYEGGFTKRGLIGQIAVLLSNVFSIELRDSIYFLQIIIITVYYLLLFKLIKKINLNRIILLAIFTPIFILYPVAEIEVLARKEIFIFVIFLFYISLPRKDNFIKILNKSILLSLSILIWEPVIFFFLYFFAIDVISKNIIKFDFIFVKNIAIYLPAILIALYLATNPMSDFQHEKMEKILKNEFDEACYMSCALLKSKSTILQQFQGNLGKYSPEIVLRYLLIILVGFTPLFILLRNSKLQNKDLYVFKYFNNLLYPFLIMMLPLIILFTMMYDWGRIVNICYVFSIITYIFLYKKNLLIINQNNIMQNPLSKLNKKIFIFIFIIFCFGWNPKTVISDDVASFPGYRIPYKFIKLIN